MDTWLPILNKLSLSRTEKEVVKRYEVDPLGRTFLPVADILRSHKLVDESIELLIDGVGRHSNFAVARVVLARELMLKGMIEDAWELLEDSPVSLNDNLLAQKIIVKLAILMGNFDRALQIHKHLQDEQMLDREMASLGQVMTEKGFESARQNLVHDLKRLGVDVQLPKQRNPEAQGSRARRDSGDRVSDRIEKKSDKKNRSELSKERSLGFKYRAIPKFSTRENRFRVTSLSNIFDHAEAHLPYQSESDLENPDRPRRSAPIQGQVELDSMTLAEIYIKQGHYRRAGAVYQRLLALDPENHYIQQKMKDLEMLVSESDVNGNYLPHIADEIERMEALDIIDRQMKFYSELLDRLE